MTATTCSSGCSLTAEYRIFNVPAERQFIIDGKPKTVRELTPGTVLTATVTTIAQPVTDRTTTVTNGTVVYMNNTNHLIVKLDNGESRSYNVPQGFQFTVEGKPATIAELRQGMKLSATKMISEPRTELSKETSLPASRRSRRSQRTWRVPVATSVGPAPFVSIR